MFSPDEMPVLQSSRATKQLIISQCPKILCIHLLRASVGIDGQPIKHVGHISFPLLLNLSPFMGGSLSSGQGSEPLTMNTQRDVQQALHLYRQLNMQMPSNVLPTGRNLPSQACELEVTNNSLCSIRMGNFNVDTSSLSSSSSRSKLYGLTAVVEHYGASGGGHYAVYRQVANLNVNDPGQPLPRLGRTWFYISDGHVSQVSEDDVLRADATLLFYEKL